MKKQIFTTLMVVGVFSLVFLLTGKKMSEARNYEKQGDYRRMELQNSNPYAIFGSDAVVLMTEAERMTDHTLVIDNPNSGDLIGRMELDMRTSIARLFDKNGALLEERLLDEREKARWLTQDRFAEKYYSISPYAYVANNPVRYTDPTGDTINVRAIMAFDQTNGTNYMSTIINDLNSQTGLTFSVGGNGTMTYAVDNNGNPVIATDANGGTAGSATARNLMIDAVGHAQTANGFIVTNRGSGGGGNQFGVNPTQVGDFIAGANGVDNRTMGYGMTFMHELSHTNIGGGLSDSPYGAGNPGPVATRMNQVRGELNAQGGNYGQRMSYPSTAVPGGVAILPFSSGANNALQNGLPVGNQPHVMHRIMRF